MLFTSAQPVDGRVGLTGRVGIPGHFHSLGQDVCGCSSSLRRLLLRRGEPSCSIREASRSDSYRGTIRPPPLRPDTS